MLTRSCRMSTMCPRSPYAKDKKPKDKQDCPVACRSILDSGKHKLHNSKSKLSDSQTELELEFNLQLHCLDDKYFK